MSPKAGIIIVFVFASACSGGVGGFGPNGDRSPGAAPNDGDSKHPGDSNSTPSLHDCTGLPGPCGKTLPVVPLGGSAYPLYNLQLTLGSQGPFRLTIDTGSPLLGVADASCTTCSMRSPSYTAMPGGAPLQQVYGCGVGFQGEGLTGWEATLAQDTVGLAGQKIPLAFASLTNGNPAGTAIPMFTCLDDGVPNTGQGIIGLKGGTSQGAQSFVDALAKTQQVPDAIALQLCDHNGRLWFGGYDPNFISGPPQFTPFVSVDNYQVGLNDLVVSGKALNLPASAFGDVMVDCGTSRLTFPKPAHDALHAAIVGDANFAALFGADFLDGSACAQPKQALTQAQLDAALPRLGLVFPGVAGAAAWTLDLPATESYLTPDTTPGAPANSYCPGIEAPAASGFTANLTLIGNTVMHTSVTIYDRVNKQMGFAPQAHCDTATP